MKRKIIAKSKTREWAIALLMIVPAILVTHYRVVTLGGLKNSVFAFFILFMSGLTVIVLHHLNTIAVTPYGLIVVDSAHPKPVEIPYNEIARVKKGKGIAEILTMSHYIMVETTKGKAYIVWCVSNAEELMDTIHDYMVMVFGDVHTES